MDTSALELASAQQKRKDPTIVFEKAVARGLMTLPRAYGFLMYVRQGIQKSAALSLRQEMQVSGAGLLVLQWLRASGLERDLSFLNDIHFVRLLLAFMAAENLDGLAWTWLERVTKGEGPAMVRRIPAPCALLDAIVAAKCQSYELEGAYSSVLQGEALFKENSVAPLNLARSWRRVAWQTTVDSWRHELPTLDRFESFLAIERTLLEKQMPAQRAHLGLYHPTKPSKDLAVSYLLSSNVWKKDLPVTMTKSEAAHKGRLPGMPWFVKQIVSLGLDTVRFLSKEGQNDDAVRILELLRTHIGRQESDILRTE
jgi:hypothetical protein